MKVVLESFRTILLVSFNNSRKEIKSRIDCESAIYSASIVLKAI